MKHKLISCILPTFNRINFLQMRINELLAAVNCDLEIIVINDGGKNIKCNSNKIKIINLTDNSGSVSIPRNIGISHCQGDYICHIDDDVIQYPRKFEILAQLLEKNNTHLVYGQRYEIKNEHIIKTSNITEWNPKEDGSWGVDNGQIMYKRSIYNHIPYVFCRRGCDWELAKQIRKISNPFVSTNEVVCGYIWHNNNRSLNDNTKIKKIYPSKYKKYFIDEKIELPDVI